MKNYDYTDLVNVTIHDNGEVIKDAVNGIQAHRMILEYCELLKDEAREAGKHAFLVATWHYRDHSDDRDEINIYCQGACTMSELDKKVKEAYAMKQHEDDALNFFTMYRGRNY